MRLSEMISKGIDLGKREPDGLLHCSSHLASNLRHTLLSFHPDIPKSEGGKNDVGLIRMQTGTLWHAQLEAWLSGQPAMLEVDVTLWLPTGWSGRVDHVIWDAEQQGFRLSDLKTCKGENIAWRRRDGASEAHVWQSSAYWWALYHMGLPMVDEITILYLPMNEAPGAEPLEINFEPLPLEQVQERMLSRKLILDSWAAMDFKLSTLTAEGPGRVQRKYKGIKLGTWDVKLVPHYEAAFCSYPPPYCDCSTLKTTKIGHYNADGTYTARKGYEDILPEV